MKHDDDERQFRVREEDEDDGECASSVCACLPGWREAVISLASHILLSPSVIIFSHLSPCQRAREPWDEVAFGLASTISSSCKKNNFHPIIMKSLLVSFISFTYIFMRAIA